MASSDFTPNDRTPVAGLVPRDGSPPSHEPRLRNYSRPFRHTGAQSKPATFTGSSLVDEVADRHCLPRALPKDARHEHAHIASSYPRRSLGEEDGLQDIIGLFPDVPDALEGSLRRTVSLGGTTSSSSASNNRCVGDARRRQHKKTISDPQRFGLGHNKSTGQSAQKFLASEPRIAEDVARTISQNTSSSLSLPIPSRHSDVSTTRKTWARIREKLHVSTKKPSLPPSPLSSCESDIQSPLDSAALADHAHLDPVRWGCGETVQVTVNGSTRGAKVLRFDTNTLLLQLDPLDITGNYASAAATTGGHLTSEHLKEGGSTETSPYTNILPILP